MPKPTNVGIPEPVSEAAVNLEMSGGQSAKNRQQYPLKKEEFTPTVDFEQYFGN